MCSDPAMYNIQISSFTHDAVCIIVQPNVLLVILNPAVTYRALLLPWKSHNPPFRHTHCPSTSVTAVTCLFLFNAIEHISLMSNLTSACSDTCTI